MLPRGQMTRCLVAHVRAWLLFCMVIICIYLPYEVSAEYSSKDAVVILTDKNFEKEVLNSPDYWLVEFYAPWCGHCQKLEPSYKAAAKKLKKFARLGVVDATVHKNLAQKYGIQGFPTIKEFGSKKKNPSDYHGGRSTEAIVSYVLNSKEAKKLGVSSSSVTTLKFDKVHTFLTFDEKLPSAIFFGSPKKANEKKKMNSRAPSWLNDVAEKFRKGKKKKKPTVQIAFVPGHDTKISSHFGIKEENLPTVVFVHPSSMKYSIFDGNALDVASSIDFISKSLQLDETQMEKLHSIPLFPAPETPRKQPKYELSRLTGDHIRDCLKKRGKMCVIVTNSDAFNTRDGMTKDESVGKFLAKKYRRDPFKFFWSEVEDGAFKALTSFIGETDIDVIVLKPGRKAKYSTLAGVESTSQIVGFLDKIVDGSSNFQHPKGEIADLEATLSGANGIKIDFGAKEDL